MLTGHGLKDPQTAMDRAAPGDPVRAGHRERRGGGAGRRVNRRRLVRVPASSANLGPGYDALAAALSLSLELEVEETGEFAVESDIAGRPARPLQPLRARLRGAAPGRRARLPDPLRDPGRRRASARAPPRSSPASSAADHMYELDAPLFELARELEGHPDNVAAALLGGFVICAERRRRAASSRRPGSRACSPPRRSPVPTVEARAALPAEVPMADAVHNVAHASLLVLGPGAAATSR